MMPMSVVLQYCSCAIVQRQYLNHHSSSSSGLNKIATFQLTSVGKSRCKGFTTAGHGSTVALKTKKFSSIKATMVVRSRVASTGETAVLAAETLTRARATKAVALARGAAKAAKEAVTMANLSQWHDYDDDFPFKTDLLLLERVRLGGIMEANILQAPDGSISVREDAERNIWGEELIPGKKPEMSSSALESVFPHASETDSMHDVIDNGETTLFLQENEFTGGDVVSERETAVVVAKSKRRGERLEKRKRARTKSRMVAADVTIDTFDAVAKPKQGRKRKALSQMSDDPIHSFLAMNGSRQPKLLTPAEEIELSRKVQELLRMEAVKESLQEQLGREPTISEWAKALDMDVKTFSTRLSEGREGKDRMIRCNLRLVIAVARKYKGKGMNMEDLIQRGNLGLIRSCEKFDPEKGFKFSTYAHWWIRQAVSRAISEQSRAVRLPAHLNEIMARIWKAKWIISQEYQRPPRESDIAEIMDMSVEKLRLIVRSTKLSKSMEKPVGKEQSATLGEFIADDAVEDPESQITRRLLKVELGKVLKTLNEREIEVVKLRYGLKDGRIRTLAEIGRAFNITRERVRQIEAKAISKLKQPERNAVLRGYMDV